MPGARCCNQKLTQRHTLVNSGGGGGGSGQLKMKVGQISGVK